MDSKNADSTVDVSREQLVELLNGDLSREYQAIIAYVIYSHTLKGAAYMSIAEELERHAGEELKHAITMASGRNPGDPEKRAGTPDRSCNGPGGRCSESRHTARRGSRTDRSTPVTFRLRDSDPPMPPADRPPPDRHDPHDPDDDEAPETPLDEPPPVPVQDPPPDPKIPLTT